MEAHLCFQLFACRIQGFFQNFSLNLEPLYFLHLWIFIVSIRLVLPIRFPIEDVLGRSSAGESSHTCQGIVIVFHFPSAGNYSVVNVLPEFEETPNGTLIHGKWGGSDFPLIKGGP